MNTALVLCLSFVAAFFAAFTFLSPDATAASLAFAPVMARAGGVAYVPTADKARVSLEEFRVGMRQKGIVITPGFIGDDYLLSNGASVGAINFTTTQIATGSTPTSPTMRLKNNDAFLVTDIGLYIGTAVAVAGVSTAAQQAAMRLETFPNGLVITINATDPVTLNTLYNGWLSIKESSTTYYEQLWAMRFRRVGTAQRGTLVFTASNTLESTWDSPNYGMVPITPQFKMAGNKGYAFTLNLPSAITITQSTTLNVYACLRLGGYLATGGAPYAQ